MELILFLAIFLGLGRLIALWPEDFVKASMGTMLLWILVATAFLFVMAIWASRFLK